MPEELAGAHTSLLWIARLYKKASSGTVREFCEFSGILGFSAACCLTVCVRQYFLGFFHTFQLLVSICICSILLFSPTLTVPELRLPLGCLYSARDVCDTRLPVATAVGHLYSNNWWRHGHLYFPKLWISLSCNVCVLFAFVLLLCFVWDRIAERFSFLDKFILVVDG